MLLTGSSMLMNKQCILNDLNRNTYKTRSCIDLLTKMLWPEVPSNITPYSPKRSVKYLQTVFSNNLTLTVNKEDQ